MRRALEVAAATGDDVPVGAVLLDAEGREVAAAGNEREASGDPTAHAEILVLRRAAELAGTWRLDGSTLVVAAWEPLYEPRLHEVEAPGHVDLRMSLAQAAQLALQVRAEQGRPRPVEARGAARREPAREPALVAVALEVADGVPVHVERGDLLGPRLEHEDDAGVRHGDGDRRARIRRTGSSPRSVSGKRC